MSSPSERLAFSLDETSVDPSARSSITPTQSLDSIVRGRALSEPVEAVPPRCGSLRQAGRLLWRVRHARGHSQVALKGLSSSGGQAGRTFSRVGPRVTA